MYFVKKVIYGDDINDDNNFNQINNCLQRLSIIKINDILKYNI